MLSRSPRLVPPIAIAALAASAMCLPGEYTDQANEVVIPGGVAGITRTVVGDVNGDHLGDVLLGVAGSLYWTDGPSVHRFAGWIADDVNDFGVFESATVVAQTGPYLPQKLLLAMAGGVKLMSLDLQASGGAAWQVEQTIGDATWANARFVRDADFDGDGRIDVLVVKADYREIGFALGRPDGTFDVSTIGFSLNNSALDVDLADVDFDGDPELGLLTTGGLSVRHHQGTLIAFLRNPDTAWVGGAVGSLGHRFFWISKGQGTSSNWIYTAGTSPYYEGPYVVDEFDPIAVDCADHDGNGKQDALVTTGATDQHYLFYQSSSGTFGAGTGEMAVLTELTSVGTPEPNACPLAWADLDGDGALDIAAPVRDEPDAGAGHAELRVFRGVDDPQGVICDGSPFLNVTYDGCVTDCGTPGAYDHNTLGLAIDDDSWGPNAGQHLEVLVWKRVAPTTSPDTTGVNQTYMGRYLFAVGSSSPFWNAGEDRYEVPVRLYSSANVNGVALDQAPNPETAMPWSSARRRYYVQVRRVNYNTSTGQITSAGRPYVGALAGECFGSGASCTGTNADINTTNLINQEDDACSMVPFTVGWGPNLKIGDFVSLNTLPDFDPTLPQYVPQLLITQ